MSFNWMGGELPVLKPREITKVLKKLGFEMVRQKGSHQQFRHPNGRATTVPDHKGRDVSPMLLRQICKDIDLTTDEFLHIKNKK